LDDVMLIIDRDYTIENINEIGLKLLGKSKEELIGQKCYQVISGADSPGEDCPCRKSLETKKVESTDRYEERFGKYYSVKSAPIFDEHGAIIKFVDLRRDITERKQAEEKLRKNEAKFRVLLENLPQKIFLKDKNSTYISCNENYSRDLRINPDEIAGKTDYDFFPKELAEKYRGDDKRIMELGRTEELEERYIQDGQEVWVSTIKTPVKDKKGNTIGIFGIFWDITERKRAEEELHESTEKIRGITASAHDAIIMVNTGGNISYWNEAAERIFGYAEEEIIGKHLHETIAPERFHEDFFKGFKRFQETGQGAAIGKTLELAAVKKDGTEFPVELSLSAIRIKGKWNAIGIIRDISERKKREEELNAHREHIKLINKILRHDIINDLSVIKSALRLYESTKEEELLAEASAYVNKSVELINRMRELESFISSHRDLELYSVTDVCKKVLASYPAITFNIEGEGQVLADESLSSVIDNIIRNAVVHGKTDRIDIKIGERGEYCEIRIADHGVGIPDEIKEQIFEESFAYGETGGTGLGLHIVKKAMETYDGHVHVEDNTPRGAVFVLALRKVR
jgi:PAS domain S-box-containing protein